MYTFHFKMYDKMVVHHSTVFLSLWLF